MAEQKDLDYTYTLIDRIFRICIGETGDFSGAMYNGDFSMSLEQAQEQKKEFIVENLNLRVGSRVLDLGCGWGPFLSFIKDKGMDGVGLTLSAGQAKACQHNGLDVHIMDCRAVQPETFGAFDAAVSLGAFEHFCSVEDYRAGKQDEIYQSFFKTVHNLLPVGGRFYLQTMTFGKNRIEYKDLDIHADKNSDAYMLALLERQFPGSWLPYGHDHVVETAKPYFQLIHSSSGRLDYIETITQWNKRSRRFKMIKYLFYLSLIPTYLTSKAFRKRVGLFGVSANKICFERELLNHYRFVFEKV